MSKIEKIVKEYFAENTDNFNVREVYANIVMLHKALKSMNMEDFFNHLMICIGNDLLEIKDYNFTTAVSEINENDFIIMKNYMTMLIYGIAMLEKMNGNGKEDELSRLIGMNSNEIEKYLKMQLKHIDKNQLN